MTAPVKIWYVAGQRLCNFDCPYCVSVGSWSKSRRYDWAEPDDRDRFAGIVSWIGSRPFPVSVRLGSLGEPFASPFFLEQAGWLTRQPHVRYVELVSNASLLTRRLPVLGRQANLGKVSLWLTWHEGQMSLKTFIAAAAAAQDVYGCFVVVNTLLFTPADTDTARRVKAAADDAGLRFNLDLGYDPSAPSDTFTHADDLARAVPLLGAGNVMDAVRAAGGDAALTQVALTGLAAPEGLPCRAGHDYVFIDIHGQVYRCSRYSVLDRECYGNVLDPDFELTLRAQTWAPCGAVTGCCNKEDFLNLQAAEPLRERDVPSLGWTDA